MGAAAWYSIRMEGARGGIWQFAVARNGMERGLYSYDPRGIVDIIELKFIL